MRWQLFYATWPDGLVHTQLFADGEFKGRLVFTAGDFENFQTDFRFVEVFPKPKQGEAR